MATQVPVESVYPISRQGKPRPPKLRSHSHFVRVRDVPVLTLNVRKFRRGDEVVEEIIDENELRTVAHNSQKRARDGDYGIIFLGHSTDSGKEVDQPPVAGYVSNYKMGEHRGKPAVLADMFLYRDKDPSEMLRQFPRRSPEIIGLGERDSYLDALSLIKRSPELDLGLVTHFRMDKDASEDVGSVVRYKSHRDVYRFSSPDPSRFCPDEDEFDEHEDEGEPMPKVAESREGKAVKLMKHLLEALLEQIAGEEPGEEELALEEEEGGFDGDPSGLGGEEEGLGEEEMELGEEEEGLGEEEEDMGEPSGLEDDEAEFEPSEPEPSRHSRHHAHARDRGHYSDRRRESRYRDDPSDPSMDPSEPSEPSGPGRMRNRERPSRNRGIGGGVAGVATHPRKSAARLDPENEGRTSRARSAERPSRHAAGAGAGGSTMGAGYAGPTSSYTPGVNGGKTSRHRPPIGKSGGGYPGVTKSVPDSGENTKRSGVPGTKFPPGKSRMQKEGRDVARGVTESRPSRMQRDSERIADRRQDSEIAGLRKAVARLQKERDVSRFQARKESMERRVIQLEGEGYILDRERTVSRFLKCRDKDDLAAEIDDIRRYGRRSPVNQPMLPDVWQDTGGGGDRAREDRPDYTTLDTDGQGCEIVGGGIARFAMADGDKDGVIANGKLEERGIAAVSRFRESRKPSRGRRTDED